MQRHNHPGAEQAAWCKGYPSGLKLESIDALEHMHQSVITISPNVRCQTVFLSIQGLLLICSWDRAAMKTG